MSELKPELRLKKLNILQKEAVTAIANNGFKGMVIMPTGTGKSFTKFKTILKALETGTIAEGDEVWILAEEVMARRNTYFNEEVPKFNKILSIDLLSLINLKFYSHKIAPKYYRQCASGEKKLPKLILVDECECLFTALGIEALKFVDLKVPIVGFSATDGATMQVFRDAVEMPTYQTDQSTKKKVITDKINKGQISQIYMPIIYEKTLDWAIKEGILSPFVTTVIEHFLCTEVGKNPVVITKGNEKQNKDPWIGSEQQYLDFWMELALKPTVEYGFRITIKSRMIPRFLFTLGSKVELGKKLIPALERLNRKSLIFGPQLKWLEQFVPHVAYKENTLQLLEDLNEGKIKTVGSSKRLSRGVTIKGLDTVVIFLQGKSNGRFTQILGRLLRYQYQKIGKLIIVVTRNTYEEKWFEEQLKMRNYKGRVVKTLDLNITKRLKSYQIK